MTDGATGPAGTGRPPVLRLGVITTGYPTRPDCSRGIFIHRFLKHLVRLGGVRAEVVAPAPSRRPEALPDDAELAGRVRVRWFRYAFPARLRVFTDGTFLDTLRGRRWSALLLPFFVARLAAASLGAAVRNDILHCHWIVSAFFPVLFRPLHRKPVLLSVLGSDLAVLDRGLMRRLNGFVLRRVDCCVVLGRGQAGMVAGRTRRVEVIPFGVDGDFYRPADAAEKAALRRRLGLPQDAVLACCVGMFIPVKGLEMLPQICRELARLARADVRVLLIGDGEERGRLLAEMDRLGVRDRFLLPGNTPCHATPDWVRAADIALSCSRSEGLNTALCEAAAAGLPVVATRVGEVERIVAHGTNGYLQDDRDPAVFAAALARLADDPELRRRMGAASAARLADLTCRASAATTLDLYRELLGRNSR